MSIFGELKIRRTIYGTRETQKHELVPLDARLHLPPPPAREEGPILVVTADGKGVPMRREAGEEAPRRVRLKKGDKANKKRQACVGAVYTIEPFRRTAASVVDEIMHDRAERRRPAPQHKELRADLTRMIDGAEVNGKELIFSWFEEQIEARDPRVGRIWWPSSMGIRRCGRW